MSLLLMNCKQTKGNEISEKDIVHAIEEEKKEILNDIVMKRDESKAKLKELSLKKDSI